MWLLTVYRYSSFLYCWQVDNVCEYCSQYLCEHTNICSYCRYLNLCLCWLLGKKCHDYEELCWRIVTFKRIKNGSEYSFLISYFIWMRRTTLDLSSRVLTGTCNIFLSWMCVFIIIPSRTDLVSFYLFYLTFKSSTHYERVSFSLSPHSLCRCTGDECPQVNLGVPAYVYTYVRHVQQMYCTLRFLINSSFVLVWLTPNTTTQTDTLFILYSKPLRHSLMTCTHDLLTD